MKKWRIVTLRFGTARQKMALERWTNPKPQRRTCSPRYEVPSRRGKSAGVSDLPPEIPNVAIRNFLIACRASYPRGALTAADVLRAVATQPCGGQQDPLRVCTRSKGVQGFWRSPITGAPTGIERGTRRKRQWMRMPCKLT
jgi:hypothetical protein